MDRQGAYVQLQPRVVLKVQRQALAALTVHEHEHDILDSVGCFGNTVTVLLTPPPLSHADVAAPRASKDKRKLRYAAVAGCCP
jgi:hypothetical protein